MSSTTKQTRSKGSQIHNLRERRHDTYKLAAKLPEPTVCPACSACYIKGHWVWAERPPGDVHEHRCPACQRIEDRYPAGELTIAGEFATAHRDDILNLVKNTEALERAEHPLNRIMAIEEGEDAIVVSTTDVHLPHRIGNALQAAWKGELTTHYDDAGYFLRASWQRDA